MEIYAALDIGEMTLHEQDSGLKRFLFYNTNHVAANPFVYLHSG